MQVQVHPHRPVTPAMDAGTIDIQANIELLQLLPGPHVNDTGPLPSLGPQYGYI